MWIVRGEETRKTLFCYVATYVKDTTYFTNADWLGTGRVLAGEGRGAPGPPPGTSGDGGEAGGGGRGEDTPKGYRAPNRRAPARRNRREN